MPIVKYEHVTKQACINLDLVSKRGAYLEDTYVQTYTNFLSFRHGFDFKFNQAQQKARHMFTPLLK